MTLAEDLERARAGLAAASAILRAHAARGGAVPYELKDGWSPVTAADREVDAALRALLPQAGDGWLSEESDDGEHRFGCRRVWVVDPLDGTRSFVAGRPEYSTSIALVVDGEPVLGAIANPTTGFTIVGALGHGVAVEGDAALEIGRASCRERV